MWSRLKDRLKRLLTGKKDLVSFPQVFEQFQEMLGDHQRAMELIADLGEKSGGDYIFDRKYLSDAAHELRDLLLRMVKGLNLIASDRYYDLYSTLDRIFLPMGAELRGRLSVADAPYVVPLRDAPRDTPELIGGKADTLAEIITRLDIPVPDGFVITTQAYYRFLEHNGLEDRIHSSLESWLSGEEELSKISSRIRYAILAGIVPQDTSREITRHAEKEGGLWAVRSSAYGEDGEISFAGLHESVLNVASENILRAYKTVLAGLFSPEALSYRVQMGLIGEEGAMAVLCQRMIPSRASGVVQSVDIAGGDPECIAVYAAFGLGRTVVEGRSPADRYVVEKAPPHRIVVREIAEKTSIVRPLAGGGEEEVPLTAATRTVQSIPDETLVCLAKWAVALERYFKRPQEIEWAVDERGTCKLLQCRRPALPESTNAQDQDICESCAEYPILVKEVGSVAHTGVGSGIVYLVQSNEDMAGFPDGAVLVTRYTAPWLARIVPKAAAIITERGSVAGHLATIAREFRVPALVGVENATVTLHNGMEVTLDTYHRIVYAGRVKELIHYELSQTTVFEESPEFRLLRKLIKRVAPLHLVDPGAPEFTPQGCTSAHDLIRFIHEKAIQELMNLPALLKDLKSAKVWTLASNVPLGLKILDLGDGIDPEAEGSKVGMDQIRSLPLKALWAGVTHPGTWSTEPVAVDFKGLMSSLTRPLDASGGYSRVGYNLAVINRIYMNLHLRLGYHFNLIDARMNDEAHHNHIYFRFVGGVTDISRRSRRVQVLADILSQFHFNVTVKGDLVVARLLHLPKEEIGPRLAVLGKLIGFTRQLDIQLRNDRDIPLFVKTFFDRHVNIEEPSLMEGAHHE